QIALAVLVDARDPAALLVLGELAAGAVAALLLLPRLGGLVIFLLRRLRLLLLALAEGLLLIGSGLGRAALRVARGRRGRRVAVECGRLRAGGAGALRIHRAAAVDALVDLRVRGQRRRQNGGRSEREGERCSVHGFAPRCMDGAP